jgi:ATP-dependent RNA helicase DDX10/DBP4
LKDQKNKSHRLKSTVREESAPETDGDEEEKDQPKTKVDRMFAKKNQSILWSHYEKIKSRDDESGDNDEDEDVDQMENKPLENPFKDEDDEEFMTLARKDHDLDGVPTMAPGFLDRPLSVRDKRKAKLKQRIRKEVQSGTRIVYDEENQVCFNALLCLENEL